MNPLPTRTIRWRPKTVFNLLVGLLFSLSAVAQPAFLKEGLVAYYPFNGNANDESGNSYNGQLIAGSFSPNRFGSQNGTLDLNGDNQYVSIPNFTAIDNAEQATFSCWIKSPSIGNKADTVGNPIFMRWLSGGSYAGAVGLIASEIKGMVTTAVIGGFGTESPTAPMVSDQWQQMVIVFDGRKTNPSERLKYYVNGAGGVFKDYAAANPSRLGAVGAVTYIGRYAWSPISFKGKIDDVRIYNRALPDTEVKALYDYESTPPDNSFITNGLVAYYPFTNSFDGYYSSPKLNPYYGGELASWPNSDLLKTTNSPQIDKSLGALVFSSTNQYLTTGYLSPQTTATLFDGKKYTIAFSIAPQKVRQNQVMIFQLADTGGGILTLRLTSDNRILYGVWNVTEGEPGKLLYTPMLDLDNRFHSVTVSFEVADSVPNYGYAKFYLDGVQLDWENSTSSPNGYIHSVFTSTRFYTLILGQAVEVKGLGYTGAIKGLSIYNRALSNSEVVLMHEHENPKPPLVPHSASAVAQVVNGFVVGATITDAGYGYESNPVVTITGGGGTGAKATATQFNGVVTSITITNPGIGYTSAPTVTIAPPPFPPRKATSTAQIVNGFVVGTKITDGGFGYDSPPAVLLVGGGGSGATAVATVANGVVTAITITNPGTGYTSAPVVRIASPPFAPKLGIETSKVFVRMSVVLGRKYQLEASTDLNTWTTTGPAFIAQDEELVQEFDVNQVGRYFRINQVP